MVTIRHVEDIFEEDTGWFHSWWHFSFGHYHDPEQMGVGPLRVFNDDRIIEGAEWPMHPHQDIQSLTYVVDGHFAHADSLDNGGQLEPGAAQVMTFSHQGAMHSERNASATEPLRFLQFWILPSEPGLPSGVQQHQYTTAERTNRWLQIMGPPNETGLDLAQDARVLVSRLSAGRTLAHTFQPRRGGYVYVIDGLARFDDQQVAVGDAAKIEESHELIVAADTETELLLVDVPLEFTPVGVWAEVE